MPQITLISALPLNAYFGAQLIYPDRITEINLRLQMRDFYRAPPPLGVRLCAGVLAVIGFPVFAAHKNNVSRQTYFYVTDTSFTYFDKTHAQVGAIIAETSLQRYC